MSVRVYPFGLASLGRVAAHGGEYAHTQFFQVGFLPVVPLGSTWVTNAPGGAGEFPIKLRWRSVAAAYLRGWFLVLGVAVALAPYANAHVAGAAMLALSAWSWRSRSLRGVRARQRSDFDRIALGHRCDPAWLTPDMRDHMSRKLDADLAARPDIRPADEVARLGARSLDEAILAYGRLRLDAVDDARAAAGAERLLASVFEEDPAAYRALAPYREPGMPAMTEFAPQIRAMADDRAQTALAQQRKPASVRRVPPAQQPGIFVATSLMSLSGNVVQLLRHPEYRHDVWEWSGVAAFGSIAIGTLVLTLLRRRAARRS